MKNREKESYMEKERAIEMRNLVLKYFALAKREKKREKGPVCMIILFEFL